ncbi:MAG: serine/threonine-protein kinase, partial [Acidobacteriota bacterium]
MSEGSRGDSASPGRIGRYEILEELGRGGMGVVYRARDVDLDRIVALKRPLVDEGADPGSSYERFRREARAAAKLSHPNIVPIYEVFEEDDVPWLAMEYVEGSSLREHLAASRGPLPVDEVLRLGEDLAAAVQAAHAGHVLHRDINPNNILIGRDGRALVTDFGLARFHVPPEEASEASTLSDVATRSGAIRGTPGYMSPEQALGRPVDRRTDVFSLGTVLYEMCTGRQAFSGSAQGDVIDAILHREVDAIARFNYAVPDELERIVRKSLAKSADERYQDARDLLVDLRTLRRKGVAPGPVPGPPRPRRRSTLSLVLGAAFVGLIVLAWLLRGEPASVTVPPARAAVAVLPFADRTGEPDGDLRAAMVADLLGARLADSEGFRALGSRRTAEIARAVDPEDPPEVVLARLREAAATDWVILGSLYLEQDTWVATGEVHGPDEAPGTFRAEAATSVALVSAALPQVLALLGAG